ncbi:hypothetical protein [Streptomyces sp. NPDC003717]|uniref:hypothetical protein n=1 Tax=Streptomyces sp. NPDC003717 TaxID=3154276 RepID=UPI0033B0F315
MMQIAALVLDYLKVLLWPLVTFAVIYTFRDDVRDLVKRVRSLSAPGVDAEFSEEVVEVSAAAEAAIESSVAGGETSAMQPQHEHGSNTSSLVAMAYISPAGAIMAAWRSVEMELLELDPDLKGRVGPEHLIQSVAIRTGMPADVSLALFDLSRVRNEAAALHGSNPSPEAAADYVVSCESLVDWLRAQQVHAKVLEAAAKLPPMTFSDTA